MVTMRNSGHLGAVGHFAQLAARQDMVGVCMTAAGMSVLPPLGAAPRLGTNPIAVAAPTFEGPFFLYDAATSAIADNKVKVAARLGAKLAPGWIADETGEPVLEERDIPERAFYMIPTGASYQFGSHKGFGLGLVVEVLCAMLSGGGPAMLRNMTSYSGEYKHHFAAYNIESFVDIDWFKRTMTDMLRTVSETPPIDPETRVRFPGQRAAEAYEYRSRNGVPLHREVVEWFDIFTESSGIAPLERVDAIGSQ
ncbi:MAG: Ldh family oxidoreductase [Thermomicrobiales bacterium]|nr:Ldh family oxidoreductase [Thermomicrobiales bacterium]